MTLMEKVIIALVLVTLLVIAGCMLDEMKPMTDKEHAVMDELWRTVNSLRWQNERRLAEIKKYRDWLPECKDKELRKYYKKWLDWLEDETRQDMADAERQKRVAAMSIERPR